MLGGLPNYPNNLPLYGVYYLDETHQQICIVSPWMRNGNITQFLRDNPSFPRSSLVSLTSTPTQIRRLIYQIYDIVCGLDHLHVNNLVHGNLKGVNSTRSCQFRDVDHWKRRRISS